MKYMKWLSLLALLAMSMNASAGDIPEEDVLTLDQPILGSVNLAFSEGNDLLPKRGDFTISSCLLMSSQSGERLAIVTLRNRSGSQRILDKEHLVALFANGERRNPLYSSHTFSGKEENTQTISFGESQFPILRVDVRN